MKTKRRKRVRIHARVIPLLAALVGVVCLMYYVWQVPLFDRGGWHETKTGSMQYRDYYGRPLTGWLEIEGAFYYFTPDTGDMHTGWLELADNRYYLQQDGKRTVNWLELAGKRYLFNQDGVLQVGWQDTETGRYYLQEDGSMYTGWLDTADGRYYLKDDGVMAAGWTETPDGRVYLDRHGLLESNWEKTEKGFCYRNPDGSMYTGWMRRDGEVYYFDKKGLMCTGWVSKKEGRFYLYEDGTYATGFVEIDGVARYFTEKGEYVPLVNPWNEVPADYELMLVDLEGFQVDATCRDMLSDMIQACRNAGHVCVLNSTYRGISTQQYLWNNRYNNYIKQGISPEEAKRLTWQVVAYPGTSEHHLGTAIDIIGTDDMYDWFRDHSWEYGFIVRYPEDKIDVTGIIYEPWHFRYVGREMAEAVYRSGLTLEEYLESIK